MTEYLTEQEQVELLKKWIKQYGPSILIGIIIALIALFAWRHWQEYRHKILVHASGVYDEMLTLRAQNNSSATLTQAEKLRSHYPSTSYGQTAALMLARDAVLKKEYPKAEEQLSWVIDNSKVPEFRQIARIRLARVYLAEQRTDDALQTLDTVEEKSFAGLVDEVRGDIYAATNDNDSARQAYKRALKELPNAEVIRPLLQMKYDNVGSNNNRPTIPIKTISSEKKHYEKKLG